MIKEIDNG